jgi:hypothetical protein
MWVELREGANGRSEILLVGSAPISPLYGSKGVEGALAIAAPIDLGPSRRRLATWARGASLAWLDKRLPLVAASEGDRLRVVVPLSAEWGLPALTLEAVPRASASRWLGWLTARGQTGNKNENP